MVISPTTYAITAILNIFGLYLIYFVYKLFIFKPKIAKYIIQYLNVNKDISKYAVIHVKKGRTKYCFIYDEYSHRWIFDRHNSINFPFSSLFILPEYSKKVDSFELTIAGNMWHIEVHMDIMDQLLENMSKKLIQPKY